jgi:hypothetical protein
MQEVLTLSEINDRFNGEWVLIADPQVNEAMELVRGAVVFHSKCRDEVYRRAIDLRLPSSATLYTGQIPENTAVAL